MGGLIPLSDASRQTRRSPVVTKAIIVANAIVFVFEVIGGEAFVRRWSVIPADIAAGRHYITIVTAMFMHAGWMHIIGNMVFLWAFGPEIEEAMGRFRYLIFYLLSGLTASLVQVAAMSNSRVPNLGASGAIAGVMGAFLISLKPTLRIVQMITMSGRPRDPVPYAIAQKQLYASHYFETALDLSFCGRGSDNSKRPGFYLIMAMGFEQAGLTGVKGSIVRKTAVGRSVSNLRNALTNIKTTLESKQ